MNTQIRIWISALLLISLSAASQEFNFKNFDVSNGLSHNTVHCTVKDSIGMMWFGTKNGLNRYDGISFKLFKNNTHDPYSIGSNFIECLDFKDNELWVGTDSGLYRFDFILERFYLLEITRGSPILDVQNDDEGNLWFISNYILHKYNKQTHEIVTFPTDSFFFAEELTLAQNGDLWASSRVSLHKYSHHRSSFDDYSLNPIIDNDLPFNITKITALNESAVLIGTGNHGAYIYDVITSSLTKLFPTNNTRVFVRDFLKKQNNIWIATESGIFIYNLYSGKTKNLIKDYNNHFSISDNAVYCLIEDNNNGIWLGTYFGGLNYLPTQSTPFNLYYPKIGENSISGNAVREIQKDKYGNLWIGTEDAGINKFNPKTGKFSNYELLDKQNGLNQTNIHAILPLDDEIWVGTFEGGLFVIDAMTGKVLKHYKANSKSGLNSNFIISLYKTKDKGIFAITSSGIHKFNTDKESFVIVDEFPNNLFYTSFLEDSNGGLWAGTYWAGLFYYNPHSKASRVYKKNESMLNTLSNNAINGIFEDSRKRIWVTTENGLNQINLSTKEFKWYTTENGFPSNVFYSIIEDKEFGLWISTANGLVNFDPLSGKIDIYSTENGIINNQFNYNSAFKDSNGQLFFGSVGGLISFNPVNFKKNTFDSPIILTDFKINNNKVKIGEKGSPLSKSITFTDEIELQHNQSSINLEFASLNFATPGLKEYSYKMEGLNDEWVNLGTENKVFFTELPTGKYTFYVKTQIRNEKWGDEKLVLNIIVLPPLMLSTPAILVYIILALTILFLSLRYYHLQVATKNNRKIKSLNDKKEKEIYESKIEFFTNVSHEIRTPLTLIKSPLEKIQKNLHNYPDIKENFKIVASNATRLLDLVNQLLDFRKTEIKKMELTFVRTNMSKLVRHMCTRFNQAINDKKVDFSMSMPKDDVVAFVDAEAIKKILSNLVGNAVKYSSNKILINLKIIENSFEFRIENDGDTIPLHLRKKIFEPFYRLSDDDSSKGSGIGLSLASSLTELHKGNLEMDCTNSTLNIFILNIPLHQEKEFLFQPVSNKYQDFKKVDSISNKSFDISMERSKVLLVEDNLELLDFVSKELREQFIVFKATSAEEALEILENESVQIIISDVMMSEMNGFKLCEQIKTTIETSHIPIILLTSLSALNAKIEGLECGADAYIEKPFSMDYLILQILNLLKNRKHIQEHFSSTPLAHIRSFASTSTDELFLKKMEDLILENITNHEFSVEIIAEKMNMSRSTLYRKIKELSNLSPIELINISRLKKAAELLKTNEYKIYEVSDMVGYNSVTSFGRNFQRQFKMTPTEYINSEIVSYN